MSRERRKEMTLPELKQSKGQWTVDEERFNQVIRLLTTFQNDNVKHIRAVYDEIDVYKKVVDDVLIAFNTLQKEVGYIMKMVGYVQDKDTGEFRRPILEERPEVGLSV